MKLSKFIASIVCSAAFAAVAPLSATAAGISPMSQAVIDAYTELIGQDPSDYMSYYARANEYYNADDYIKALDDINSALRYTPAEETDMRYQCYVTRANIYDRLHRYSDAVTDFQSALAIDPDCVSCLYRLATMEYELGHYAKARETYERLRRVYPRNPDILFGLARVAVKENNAGLAQSYADEAVDLAANKSEAYVQRAMIRSLMQNNEGAVDDYIMAISQDDTATPRALRALVRLSETSYPAVINGLSRAINTAPRVGAFYYIRASIAQAHGNYLSAISDLTTILNENLDGYSGLNYSLAQCYYALADYDKALTNIDYAIGSTDANTAYYAMKARIRNAMKDYDGAVFAADKALAKDPDCTDAIVEKALAMVGLDKLNEASVLLAEAIMNQADNAMVYLLRAWVCGDLQNQPRVAQSLYERALDIPADLDNVNSLRGFALLFTGDQPGAERWMRDILLVDDSDGLLNYYAACLYAQAGNTERALDHMEKSLSNGYANYHNWMDNTVARVNVAPLRSLPRFKQLIDRYSSIFGR
ncbi:MAG: tetratricopeptide repeat protein [Clostridium sp.]|nr:tetratricopeptide repeat protein [Clostridium sp.]